MRIELRIDGQPRGKGRPRFSPQGGRVYTDSATVLAEGRIRGAWLEAGSPRLPDGPVRMTVIAALERPKNHWRRGGTLSAAGQRSAAPTRKPDLDNLVKLIADSLNRLAYRDDADIVDCRIVKRWCNPGESEHTVVWVSEWGASTIAAAAA